MPLERLVQPFMNSLYVKVYHLWHVHMLFFSGKGNAMVSIACGVCLLL